MSLHISNLYKYLSNIRIKRIRTYSHRIPDPAQDSGGKFPGSLTDSKGKNCRQQNQMIVCLKAGCRRTPPCPAAIGEPQPPILQVAPRPKVTSSSKNWIKGMPLLAHELLRIRNFAMMHLSRLLFTEPGTIFPQRRRLIHLVTVFESIGKVLSSDRNKRPLNRIHANTVRCIRPWR
jgi:hypothetical protein